MSIFRPLASRFSLEELERDPSVVIAVDGSLRVRWANGDLEGIRLGTPLLDAIHGDDLQTWYAEALDRWTSADRPADHVYHCHTSDRFRLFALRAYPLGGQGLLMVHSVVEDRPHDWPAFEPDPGVYLDAYGILHQCSHCRRTRRMQQPERWDFVPAFLQASSPVSHGLCPPCTRYYYGDLD